MKFDFVAFDASKVYAGNVFYYVVLYFLNPAKQSFYLHIGNVNCETMDIYSKMRNKVYFFYKRKNYVHTKSYQAVVLVSIDPIKRLLCRVFYDKLQDDTTYPSQWAVLQPWVATHRKLNALSEYFAKKSCFINYLDETPAACLVNYCHRDENVKITLHNSINRLNRDRAIDDIEDLFDRKNRLFSRYYRKALVHHMFMRDHAALKINKHHARNSGNQLKMINFIYFLFLSILLKNDDFFHRSIALISLIIPIENFEIGYSCDKDDTTDIIITHGKRGHHGPLIKMSYKSFRLYCVIIALITAILLLYLICLQVYYYTRLSSERIEIMDEIMEKLGMPPASFVNDDYRQPARGMSFGELNEQWNSSVTHRVEHPSDVSIERNSINRSRYPMTPDYLIDVKKSGVNSDEELHKKINDEIEEKINEEIEAKNNEIDKVDVKFEEEYATKGSEYEGHYSFPVTPNISTKALKGSSSTNMKTSSILKSSKSKSRSVTFNERRRKKLSLSTTFSSIGGRDDNFNFSNRIYYKGLPNTIDESQFTNTYPQTNLTDPCMATDDDEFTDSCEKTVHINPQPKDTNTYVISNHSDSTKTQLNIEEKTEYRNSLKQFFDKTFRSYNYIDDEEETTNLLQPKTI